MKTSYLDMINDERRRKKGKERERKEMEGNEKGSTSVFGRCRKFLNNLMMNVLTGRRKPVLQKNRICFFSSMKTLPVSGQIKISLEVLF